MSASGNYRAEDDIQDVAGVGRSRELINLDWPMDRRQAAGSGREENGPGVPRPDARTPPQGNRQAMENAEEGQVLEEQEELLVLDDQRQGNSNASLGRMSNLPPLSNGSIKSHSNSSSSSRKSRRVLLRDEKLAAIREEQRQIKLRFEEQRAKAEAERLEDQARLIIQQYDLDEDEDDQLDGRSSVLSVPVRRPDVADWVDSTSRAADFRRDEPNQEHLQRPNHSVNAPHSQNDSRSYFPTDGNNEQRRISSESEGFQRMADTFASTMKTVLQTARPNDDLRNFVARQSGGKDLPEFHGEPEEWPAFFGRFERSTELCGFSNEENIARLQKSLKGKAKESVVSMLASACNVDDVISVLRKRFGRPDQIVKRMLERAKNAPPPSEGDFQSIVDFSITVKNFCATAQSLNLPLYLNNPQLLEEFRRKLPSHLQLEWGRHLAKSGVEADLKELSSFLDEVAEGAVFVCDVSASRKSKVKDQCLVVTDVGCPLKCKEAHGLSNCQKFKKMKVQERWDCVKKMRVCFCCLEKGHSKPKCPNSAPCPLDGCTLIHHKLLHYDRKRKNTDGSQDGNKDGTQPNVAGVVSQTRMPISNVLMKVAPVELVGPKGRIVANAFLDDGSSLTMIEDGIAKRLGLEGETRPLDLNWLGGRRDHVEMSRLVSLKIRGLEETEEFQLENVRTKEQLDIPVRPIADFKNLKKWTHLEEVPFPKVLQKRPSIIIGSDHSRLLLPRKASEGPSNAPIAVWTYLGWVAHGPDGRPPGMKANHVSLVNVEGQDPDQALHDLVKEQFRLEALGVVNCQKFPQSKENERADMIMEKTSRRIGDSWETGMLWKTDQITLPESWCAAARRLKVLEKQMDKDEDFAQLYCAKIDEYLQKGFCRKLSKEEAARDTGRVWYLPHFGRTNPNKPGKLRLVFDCAAKVNGTSLNDALLQGPDLMSPLINVLLKFRQREIAFSGDIRDMFHRIHIRQEDVAALRFLWRGRDRRQPPEVYTMDVMIFGAVSSPYQAQWIKNRNAEEFEEQYPEAVDAIKNRHYVDDYLDSCETVEQAIKKIMDVREIHRRGAFEIRGWLCNNKDVLKVVDPGEQVQDATLDLKEDKLERVLGLHWDPKLDAFKFQTSFRAIDPKIMSGERVPTKRELLKLIMSLFDPLGFIAHLTVRGRILLQDVWRSKIGWDEKLPLEMETKWTSLLEQIKKIPEAVIPRCFAPTVSKCEDLQLHVFCDASQQGFSAVAYIRATGRGGNVSVNIVLAKSRVTPIKCVSIPRLEMEAGLIGARIANFIKKNCDLPIKKTYLWTDSRNVLCWIRADDPSRFKVYIAHRIGEILDLTEVEDWRWVPTAENVADDATRDTTPADVSPSSRWFNGPAFLKKSDDNWPNESEVKIAELKMEDLEVKRDCCMVITHGSSLPNVTDFSDWRRLIRVTAWVKRYIHNLRAKSGHGEMLKKTLTVEELKDAVNVWIARCQESCFPEELEALRKGNCVERSSRLFMLSPILWNGIICVKSRVANSPHLPEDDKFPIILDPKDTWTKLLLSWYHHVFGHHGIQMICNEVRQKYWILGMKAAVKKAAKECLECRMAGAKQMVPEMAALPEVRVRKPLRPFSYVGVDYFGPLEVVNGRKREKRYGALFTCLSTRAVHLEVAFSLSTDDFLMALCRFMCRRGEPLEIWSDNGTNFKGAEKELRKALKELDQPMIEDKLASSGIKWTFIPPGAPHMGGAWERLVRSVKTAMLTILKNRSLNDQLLQTVLLEAEASVNSRPLTSVSVDKDDPEAITPNCFLVGTTSMKQPPGVFQDADLSLRKRWRQAQVLANHFWSRWVKEYLPSLALRGKWNKDTPNVVVGELVFVADLNQQRNLWTKGVVVEVFPQKIDGRVRIVDVKTAAGIIRRPVAKLYRIQGWNCDSKA